MPKPLCLACVTLEPKCQINPSDNQAHPDLDVYSLLFLWRSGHLFQLLTYRVLTQRLSHPKHSWLLMFALTVGAPWGLVRRDRAVMGCRDISVTLWTVQDLWKKVTRKKKFGRVLPVASLSKQALSDTGGCRSSTCAGEMPQRHFVFGNSRKFTAAISKTLDLCARLLPPRRLWRSCARHLHNFATMI